MAVTFQCPTCQRAFAEAGFCPFDGQPLGPPGNAGQETQLSMAMPSQPGPMTGPRSVQPGSVDPAKTHLMPSTGDITNAVQRPVPEPRRSEPVHAVSGSENPAELLQAVKAARDSEYDKLVGQTLDGRYLVQKKIGEGGMGVVFAARHAVIERPLAIKVLKREVMRDQATIRRFVQEAKAASRIGHPNIVDVTDFGTTPDGMTYSVMEYVSGPTLGQAIRAGAPFEVQRVVKIGAQIARALGAAHDKGIVHRDLKPENVFLVDRDGRIDFVKIVDFGIAKVTPTEGQDAGPRLTRAGSVFGTPEYMAPEQAAGRSDTDGRADIYALGVIMYEMLVGRVPHKGDTMVRTLAMQMLDPAIPPSKVRPDLNIPASVEAVVLHALVKKREQRYQTMGELLAGLEQAQASLPPPVGLSVTGSPMYALAPMPGADPSVQPLLPQMPLPAPSPSGNIPTLDVPPQPYDRGLASSTNNPTPTPLPPTLPRDGGVHPPSTNPPPRSKAPTNQPITQRPKNEPQFVTSEKPITFEHVLTEEMLAPARPKRWPLVVALAIVLLGIGGVVAFVMTRDDAAPAARDAGTAAIATPGREAGAPASPDASVAIITPSADATELAPSADAAVALTTTSPRDASDLVLLADAYVHARDGGATISTLHRDASTAPVYLPDAGYHHGTVQVEVLTKPDSAQVFVGTSYRGPNGVKLEEAHGTKLEIQCRQRGYKPGNVTILFDGNTQVVLCVLTRIKTCVGALKNPFDECPDDAGSP